MAFHNSIAKGNQAHTTAVASPCIEILRMALASPVYLHHIPLLARLITLGKKTILLTSLGIRIQVETRSATVVVKNRFSGSGVWTCFLYVILRHSHYQPNTAFEIAPPKWDISRWPVFTPPTKRRSSFFS